MRRLPLAAVFFDYLSHLLVITFSATCWSDKIDKSMLCDDDMDSLLLQIAFVVISYTKRQKINE